MTTGKRDYAAELLARGKKRTAWALPIDLIDELEEVAEGRTLGVPKLVELLLRDGLDRIDDKARS